MRRRFQSGFSMMEIMSWREGRAGNTIVPIRDRGDALRILRAAAGDPLWMSSMRALLGVEGSGVPRLSDAEVLDRLAWRLARGELVVVRGPTLAGARTASPGAEGEAAARSAREDEAPSAALVATPPRERGLVIETLTYIEVEMVDDAGEPAAGEAYEIVLTDGSTRKGTLDSLGRVRFDGIPPGNCEIRFPGLDASSWKPIAG